MNTAKEIHNKALSFFDILPEGQRIVTTNAMYISRSIRDGFLGGKVGLKLMRTAFEWTIAQKAKELHIHATSGVDPERMNKLLTRLGFKTYGGNYAGRVG